MAFWKCHGKSIWSQRNRGYNGTCVEQEPESLTPRKPLPMQTEEITIRVDADAARAYRAASDQQRRKLDLLLSLRLHEALRPGGSLKDLMRKMSRKAQERGLTPEILDAILHEP